METMNDTDAPADPPPYREPGNRLTRSSDDKVVGGLAGGLGQWFGIDPVVFRIAFVVLTLAGGSGILLYLVGWLMIPDDRGGTALRRVGTDRKSKLAAAVLAGAGLLLLLDNIGGGNDDIPLGIVLVGLGGLYLWSRQRSAGGGAPPAPPSGDIGTPPEPTPATDPEAAPRASSSWEPAPTSTTLTDVAVDDPPAGRRPRSAVVPVTLSLLAMLAGGLSLAGASVTTGLGLALLLTGGALVFGAWRGRAKWLIPVGLVLAFALVVASIIDVPIRGGTGDVVFRPLAAEEIQTPYRLAAGRLTLDLTDIDLRGQTVTIEASVAAGHLDILVPVGVAVDVDAHAGAGELMVLGRTSEGLDVGRRVSDPGREGAGRLELRARAGMGLVEVRRAS